MTYNHLNQVVISSIHSYSQTTNIINIAQEHKKMHHTQIKITGVQVFEPYKIKVRFHDGKVSIIDLEPVLYGELLGELRDPQMFQTVRLNKEVASIEWLNSADFHPETLYNWHYYKHAMHCAALKRK